MLIIPTIEDCAKLKGLDVSCPPRHRPEPTLREIRIAAKYLRTPAGVWLPRAAVEGFLRDYAIIRTDDPETAWWSFYEEDQDGEYDRLMSGAPRGTGYWSEWLDMEPSAPERMYSLQATKMDPPFRPGLTPLPGGDMIEAARDKLDAQLNAAIERMQKTIAADLGSFMFSIGQPVQIKAQGFAPPDPGEVFFSIPAQFQFGFTGFKGMNAAIDAAGTFLLSPLGATAEEFRMNRLREQGFEIEVIKEEEGEK